MTGLPIIWIGMGRFIHPFLFMNVYSLLGRVNKKMAAGDLWGREPGDRELEMEGSHLICIHT